MNADQKNDDHLIGAFMCVGTQYAQAPILGERIHGFAGR